MFGIIFLKVDVLDIFCLREMIVLLDWLVKEFLSAIYILESSIQIIKKGKVPDGTVFSFFLLNSTYNSKCSLLIELFLPRQMCKI